MSNDEALHTVNDDEIGPDDAPEAPAEEPATWRDFGDMLYDFAHADEAEDPRAERETLTFEALLNIRETLADIDETIERGFQKLALNLARRNDRDE